MTGKRIAWLATFLAIVLAVSGCVGSLTDSDEGAPNAFIPSNLGMDVCWTTAGCHDSATSFDNNQIYSDWSQAGHANVLNVPDTNFFGNSPENCTGCHDISGDSANLGYGGPGDTPINRPVVGCEACHGGVERHFSSYVPPPYPLPDFDRCGQCHNQTFDTVSHGAPEGEAIVENYRASPHFRSVNDAVKADANRAFARCSKCHTDRGAKDYRNVSGGYDTLVAALPRDGTAATPNIFPAEPVQCRTCHFGHTPEDLLLGQNENVPGSSEFNTCTNCHQLTDSTGSRIRAYHDPVVNTRSSVEEIITDTHFGEAGSFTGANGANVLPIAGYVLDANDGRVCRNCHNQHSADLAINRQWIQSDHADTTALGAWAHYNWSDRPDCQRCHTLAGYQAYAAANADGDDSDYSPPLSPDPNYRPQMLYCHGCHADNAGGLNSTGPMTADYSYYSGSTQVTTESFAYTGVAGSNLCMPCHTALQSGATIAGLVSGNGVSVSFSNQSRIQPHYLAAGGVLYRGVGYEYAGTIYDDYPFFRHNAIGIAYTAGLGVEGPCIGCHLSSPESHLLSPFSRDSGGRISSVASTACGGNTDCHVGQFALDAAELNEEEERFHEALDALEQKLATNGYFFAPSYPYFFNTSVPGPPSTWVTDWLSPGDTQIDGSVTGKDNMGAAFNFDLLHHDPGAWVHNRRYTKRLIFDSIDWLEDNTLDGTVDLSAFPEAAAYLDGDPVTTGVQRP
ncbi:MAG: hypothetical protein JSV26_02640 [bacterium]|nr:MAG: hypothetical protein JSV26_02640 [bacterium]